jgi:hypothetical protein
MHLPVSDQEEGHVGPHSRRWIVAQRPSYLRDRRITAKRERPGRPHAFRCIPAAAHDFAEHGFICVE